SRALMRSLIRSSLSTGVAMRHHSKRETGGRWKATSALFLLQLLWRSFDPDAPVTVAGWGLTAPLSSFVFARRVAVRGHDLDSFGRTTRRRRGRRQAECIVSSGRSAGGARGTRSRAGRGPTPAPRDSRVGDHRQPRHRLVPAG